MQIRIADPECSEIVRAACERSFGALASLEGSSILITDAAKPSDLAQFKKIVVLGHRPTSGALAQSGATQKAPTLAMTPIGIYRTSPQRIEYADHPLCHGWHFNTRHFERYDFAREWNNLGYGRIEVTPQAGTAPFAWCTPLQDGEPFVALYETERTPVLWINRAVGLIDGFDHQILERFLELPITPQFPEHYDAAISFRIDCDEAILSGRPLFELYRRYGVPFSLAIKSDQKIGSEEIEFMREVVAAGGSILSHSHVHAPNWGEPVAPGRPSFPGPKAQGDAHWEASTSIQRLKEALPELKIQYAVSPFHQNSREALQKIYRAGIQGFIGGIIQNDPEFLVFRGGQVPFVPGMITHSQQCMFHGDCVREYLENGQDPLQVYKAAFLQAVATRSLFGYLDHPFSGYQYGWKDEAERLAIHEAWLNWVQGLGLKIWFASSVEGLEWVGRARAIL